MQENIVFRGNLCKGFFQSSFLEEAVPGEARLRAALPILCVGSRAIPTGRGQQDNRTTGQFTACQINTQQHKKKQGYIGNDNMRSSCQMMSILKYFHIFHIL